MNIKKIITYLMVFLTIGSGCRKFIDVGLPKHQLITKVVFENDTQAIAALANVYSSFTHTRGMGYNTAFYLGMAADEFTAYTTSAAAVEFYQNFPQPINASSNGLWDVYYTTIYQTNAILEGCSQSTGMSATIKKQLMAESRFMRAFCYFYLVNLWGDVPLVLTTDYESNRMLFRSSTLVVYNQIIADLEHAAVELNPNYVDATATYKPTYTERVRPNQAAANAFLSRVYLYVGNWAKAEQNATSVIDNSTQYYLVSLNNAFLKNNKEAIWQLMTQNSGTTFSTTEGNLLTLVAKPASSLSNSISLSTHLLAAFNPGDLRHNSWVGTYVDNSIVPNVTYYFPNKYKERNGTSFKEYTTPLRLAEQYLIRAEARGKLNNIDGGRDDLNKVLVRAGLGNTTANSPAELQAAVLKVRQVELFAEWGHRWLDLKRTGNIDAVMATVTPEKGGGAWNPDRKFFPIPQKDIEANNNLKQNLGYN